MRNPALLASSLLVSSLLVLSSILSGGAALADTGLALNGFSFGPSVSTLGIGGEAGYRFNDSFGVRGKAQGFSVDGDGRSNDVRYKYSVDLFTAGAIADYYPMGGGLRLSAGGYYDDNHVDIDNRDNSTVRAGGATVPIAAGTITGHGEYNKFAPYVGVGYDGKLGAGFELGFDLGVIYQGNAKVNASSGTPLVPQADVLDVRDDVKDAMDNLRFYPVVGINATYRF